MHYLSFCCVKIPHNFHRFGCQFVTPGEKWGSDKKRNKTQQLSQPQFAFIAG